MDPVCRLMARLKEPMSVALLNIHPAKVLEGCRVRWSQTFMGPDRSMLPSINRKRKLPFTKYSYYTLARSKIGNHVVYRSQGRVIACVVRKCMSEDELDGMK